MQIACFLRHKSSLETGFGLSDVDQILPEPLILIEKNELGVSYARIRVIFIFGSAARATRGRIAALAEAVAARDLSKSRIRADSLASFLSRLRFSIEADFAAEILCVNTPSVILLVEVPRPGSCLLFEILAGDISKESM
jgi:hypothetical protein